MKCAELQGTLSQNVYCNMKCIFPLLFTYFDAGTMKENLVMSFWSKEVW